MRINWVLPNVNMSGGIKVVGIYASLLQERGHDVRLLAQPNPKSSFKSKISLLIKHGKYERYKSISDNHLSNLNLNIQWLPSIRAVQDYDVPDGDIVIATFWNTAKDVANLSPQKGVKFYFMQDYGVGGMEFEKLIPTWNLPLNIITIADWISDSIFKETGRNDVIVVPNGVEQSFLQSAIRTKQPVPTFGFVYREDPIKGYDLILEAFIKAKQVHKNLKFVTFGPRKPLSDLPDGFDFILSPKEEKVRELYASCDAWLFASRSEGFGLPIIEAMACRTPVIGTSAGVAPQYINDQNGALVEPTSEAFVEQITRFSDMSNDEWQQISDNAYRRVSGYTWHDASLLFEKALRNAIKKSPNL